MDGVTNLRAMKAPSACLLALSATVSFAGAMGPEAVESAGSIYLGAFGGWAGVSSTDIKQFGTAFFSEANGGPLAVNSFGTADSGSTGVVGGHIGFSWSNILGTHLSVTPAVELEGYYMGNVTFQGHDISNDTTRLPEHDFLVTYPMETGVFLVNAVLNSKNPVFGKFRPYVGIGIGSAIISISGADALQISPAEPGLNHYNSDPNDKEFAFAAQPKVGVHYDFNQQVSVFAEYRFLYLSETHYTFGSTVATGHVATSPWLATIQPQQYNMGTIGIDFDV